MKVWMIVLNQKKLRPITSSDWHSLKSKALKRLKIGHRLPIVLHILSTSQKKKNVCLSQERVKCSEIARGNLKKNHKNCSPPWHGVRQGQKSVRLLNLLNRQPFLELAQWAVSAKNDLLQFHYNFLLWHKHPLIFQMSFIRSIISKQNRVNMFTL